MINKLFSVLIFYLLSGCMVWRVPTMEDQRRARELIDVGVTHLRSGELVAAENSFELAQELFDLPEASDGLGCVAFLRDEDGQAETHFRTALEIDYGYTEAYGNLALLYEKKGDFSQAEALFQQALELDPANYRVRNNYAIFLKQHTSRESDLIRAHLLKASLLSASPLVEGNISEISAGQN